MTESVLRVCTVPKVAFSVFIDQTQSASSVVDFNNVAVNVAANTFKTATINFDGPFDTVTNNFVVPWSGLYWQHMQAFSDVLTMCDYSLIGTADFPRIGVINDFSIPSTSSSQSRDDIRWLPKRAQLYATSLYSMGIATTLVVQAAWSAFKLNEFMSPLVAFNVYQNSTITTPSSQSQPVPFNNVVVNEGGGWNVTSYTFNAPVAGIYVFSYGTAGQLLLLLLWVSRPNSLKWLNLVDNIQQTWDLHLENVAINYVMYNKIL